MPLTNDFRRESKNHSQLLIADPVKAGERVFVGSLAVVDATGFAVNATGAAGEIFRGVVRQGFDNTNGADGVRQPYSERTILSDQRGLWPFPVSGAMPAPEAEVFIADNGTIKVAPGVVKCGRMKYADENGWAWIDVEAAF